MPLTTLNPATGETLKQYEPLSAAEIETKLQRAMDAFHRHRRTSFAQRAERMLAAATILDAEREQFGRLMTTEMGKPLKAAIDEAKKCAWACRHYAECAERYLADEIVHTDAAKSFIR